MTITIRNPNPVSVTGLAVSDTYPTGGHPIETDLTDDLTGLVSNVVSPPTNSCNGTLIADAVLGQVNSATQTNRITLSGGSVSAGGTCEIRIPVLACPGGRYINGTSDLTSSAGVTLPAAATLFVSCPVNPDYLSTTGTGLTGPGDLNCDGVVNSDDLTIVTSKNGLDRAVDIADWDPAADPNCDGYVTSDDLTIVTSVNGMEY